MASDAARTIDGVTFSVTLLSSLMTIAGAAIIIGPGFFNPLRFGPKFILIGVVFFFVPGLLGIIGAYFFRREKSLWSFLMAALSVFLQTFIAAIATVLQLLLTPISPVPLLLSVAWTFASAIALWRLCPLLKVARASVESHRGFVIEADIPEASVADPSGDPSIDQIDNVREK